MKQLELFVAAYSGDLETANRLVTANADLDATDAGGATALHWASQRGHIHIVRLLLEYGANPHARNKDGNTPLDYALNDNHPNFVIASELQKAADKRDLMFSSASTGDIGTVTRLLSCGIGANIKDEKNFTALSRAAWAGHNDVVRILLNNGADTDVEDLDGWTALTLSTYTGNLETVHLLLEYGADPLAKNRTGTSALSIAVLQRHRTIAQLLQSHRTDGNAFEDKGIRPLIAAAFSGDANEVSTLLSDGINLNACKDSRLYPLVVAAGEGHSAVVELLLRHGANPQLGDNAGFTALMRAVPQGHIQVVRLLLRYGADPSEKDEEGSTPLSLALREEQLLIFKELLVAGADPDTSTKSGTSLLGVAAYSGGMSFVQTLIDHGVDIDALGVDALFSAVVGVQTEVIKLLTGKGVSCNGVAEKGYTALSWTARTGDVETASLLLGLGANPNVKELVEREWTPLHLAAINGNLEMVHLLLEHGADPNIRSSNGFTPLDIAKAGEHTGVFQVLDRLTASTGAQQAQSEPAVRRAVKIIRRPTHETSGGPENTLEKLLQELNSLIGLSQIKKDVLQLVNFLRIQQMRREKGLTVPEQSLHMVFTGSPGTGKTTIARLLAKIYSSLNILSKGHFVETDRSGLVAGYLGQTAIRVREVVESALGGILFIDEAYSLTHSEAGRDEFGYEAVNTLLKLMEDHRADLIVIVAGYTEPMKKFIRSNPGLQSRFNKFITFEDYSPSELAEIFERFAVQNDYEMTEEAVEKIIELFTHLHSERDEAFGNARLARNIFEDSINNQANRLVLGSLSDQDSLQTLTADDISSFTARMGTE